MLVNPSAGRTMIEDSTREKVLEIFTRHRVSPNAPFDEDHFMDFFLVNPRRKKGLTSGTFTGLRRRNRFLEEVEQEFLVCFGTKDLDRIFSVQRFVERVVELQSSPKSSRGALKARLKRRSGWGAVVVIDFFILSLALWSRGIVWLAIPLVLCAVGFSLWAGKAIQGTKRHDRALALRLGVSDA